jgi:hypothetical protein
MHNDVVFLDYCCTPAQPFVIEDMKLCKSKWVFATFSRRGCRWKAQVKHIVKNTRYKIAWSYLYNDTSPMLLIAYSKTHSKPPPKLVNPVGKQYKYKWKRKWYYRNCKKLLLPPADDAGAGLYLEFKDSNEPMSACTEVW